MAKDNIVGVRLTPEELRIIDEASEVERRPRSQFMAKVVLDYSKQLVGENNGTNQTS